MVAWICLLLIFPFIKGAVDDDNDANSFPHADFSYSPTNAYEEDLIQFYDESYDADGYIVEWYWNFGDGSYSYQQNPSHVYSNAGYYDVTLTVTDNEGASDSISKLIYIQDSMDYGNESSESEGSDGNESQTEDPLIVDFNFKPDTPSGGQYVHFWETCYGDILNWTWNIDYQYEYYGREIWHRFYPYNYETNHYVELIVTSRDGQTKSKGKWITVYPTTDLCVAEFKMINELTGEEAKTVHVGDWVYFRIIIKNNGGYTNYDWFYMISFEGEFYTYKGPDLSMYETKTIQKRGFQITRAGIHPDIAWVVLNIEENPPVWENNWENNQASWEYYVLE